MRYVYAGPDVTIPVSDPGLRSRRRFQEDDSEIPSARRIFWRARLWPSRAFPGSMTNLAGSRSKWTRPLGFVTSPRVTGPRAWATRVVVRTMTGVSRNPESSNAKRVRSRASWGVAGSRRGRFAKRAKRRLSCSFWLEWHPGSSAVTRTRDPRTPLYARVIRASEATLTPTCFMNTRALSPPIAAAAATSTATFSLTAYWNVIPAAFARSARTRPISEDGVPGYVDARSAPASRAPRAIASFPRRSRVSPGRASRIRSYVESIVRPPGDRRESSAWAGPGRGPRVAAVASRGRPWGRPGRSPRLRAPVLGTSHATRADGTWVTRVCTTPYSPRRRAARSVGPEMRPGKRT